MNRFDKKDPNEKVTLTFDFSAGLAAGETLTSLVSVSVSVTLGTDPSPTLILNGVGSIESSLLKYLQPVQAGLDDTDYFITVVMNTSNAQKVLALSAVLPVRKLI